MQCLSLCVSERIQSYLPVVPDGNDRRGLLGNMAGMQARNRMVEGTGHCLIMLLTSSLVYSTAEDLHTSQLNIVAQRANSQRSCMYLGTWNIRSLLVMKVSAETARQESEVRHAEDRRVDLGREMGLA